MILQNFIVFEGIDGAGTTTQQKLLQKKLQSLYSEIPCHTTAEPTSSPTGKFLRSILKGEVKLAPQTVAYLFAADRQEHLISTEGIIPRCNKGEIVISDRYLFSSLAYQSAACGPELPRLLNSNFPLPEYLFYFDIEPSQSLKRIAGRGVTEIYENQPFLEATLKEYRKVIAEYEALCSDLNTGLSTGMTIVRIDASQSQEIVAENIWSVIKNMPILRG